MRAPNRSSATMPSSSPHIASGRRSSVFGRTSIAGGHVASLLNRLQLFGIGELAAGKSIFAWCGGAMVVTERVVLFHDSPPQGTGAPEVLDAGLALVGDVVAFPQPEFRLALGDR